MLALLWPGGCGLRRDPDHLARQLEREVQALNQIVRDLREQAETCEEPGRTTALYADLHQVFSGTEAEVFQVGITTVVRLPVGLLFTDRYELRLREEATMQLDLLATALRLHPNTTVEVVGHTDDGMLPPDIERMGGLLGLSWRYAEAVARKLTAEFDVDPARFTVSARGPWAPIASNDVPSGQERNRRVEVRIRPGPTRPEE